MQTRKRARECCAKLRSLRLSETLADTSRRPSSRSSLLTQRCPARGCGTLGRTLVMTAVVRCVPRVVRVHRAPAELATAHGTSVNKHGIFFHRADLSAASITLCPQARRPWLASQDRATGPEIKTPNSLVVSLPSWTSGHRGKLASVYWQQTS